MQKLDFQNRETNFWLCRKFAKNQNYPDAFLMSQAVDQNVLKDGNKELLNRFIEFLKNKRNDQITSQLYQDMFAELLLVDRSQERKRKLSRRITENINSDSRTREDVDTFFLSVDLQEARNLKPALDYISEKDFEVYVLNSWQTNSVYNFDDKDLFGSIHSDFPIMMPIAMPEIINEEKSAGAIRRLSGKWPTHKIFHNGEKG